MLSNLRDNSEDRLGKNFLPFLLLWLTFTLLIVPALENARAGPFLSRLGITGVIIFAAVATRRRKSFLVGGLVVALFVVPMSWMTLYLEYRMLFVISCLLESAFFVIMAVLIVGSVIRSHAASLQSILGAMCGYLLLGLAWTMIYWALDSLDEESFQASYPRQAQGHGSIMAFSQMVYYSFVTMSTLGYGDVVPTTSWARTAAWMQSVVGQFYMAVIVAWTVSQIVAPQEWKISTETTDSNDPESSDETSPHSDQTAS